MACNEPSWTALRCFPILGAAVQLGLKPSMVFRHYSSSSVHLWSSCCSTQHVGDSVHTATSKPRNPRMQESTFLLYSLPIQVLLFHKGCLLLSYFPYVSSDFQFFFFFFSISFPLFHLLWLRILFLTQNCGTSCSSPSISTSSFQSFHVLNKNSLNPILLLKKNLYWKTLKPSSAIRISPVSKAGCAIICPACFPTSRGGARRACCLSWVLCVSVTRSGEVLCLGTGCECLNKSQTSLKSFPPEKVESLLWLRKSESVSSSALRLPLALP